MSRSDGEARSTPAAGTPAPGMPAPGGGCPPVGIQLEGIILPPVLTLDVVLGLLGNAVALWVFCFRLKRWNANTVFLVNLVAADYLALVSLPLRIHALLAGRWVFGDVACRLNLFLMFSNRTASIALMTVIAFYRYAKVVHPLGRLTRLSKRQAGVLALLVWLLVSAPRLPMLAYDHVKRGRGAPQCFFFTSYQEASRGIMILVAMHHALTVLEFVVALALLLFCWVRIRRSLTSHRQMGDGGKRHHAGLVAEPRAAAARLRCLLRAHPAHHRLAGPQLPQLGPGPHPLRLLQLSLQEGAPGCRAPATAPLPGVGRRLVRERCRVSLHRPGGARNREADPSR
ncbi:oxoeicosanoid receptor 1-like isoform X2 [Syngnathus scovelli]|uniref:oxoeicosanoid receptor 1-like isoform X2 n=1 Tax=Syngnathus scovelli TaxID=161590 RepID=UPI00210FD321|nr:oxoeicosanoid receptor 1-like isoform X2 [Syngnathus scovelli]